MNHDTCSHLLADLSDYLDGAASSARCAEIEQHLADCVDCRAVVATLRKTVDLYHALPAPALSDAVRRRLLAALDTTAPSAP